ncbi:hypothetical protein Bca52824_016077 [Brassica carinata]|uniref:Uncharacterized protein n=1 Tax=Brassica carinata TaxID=52824 RepID=A0A8X7W4F8_BRACI|nr:hypothetical protein Bca52824_016077 [Brassica carinata]
MLPLSDITRRLHRWAPGPLPRCQTETTGSSPGARRDRTACCRAPAPPRAGCRRFPGAGRSCQGASACRPCRGPGPPVPAVVAFVDPEAHGPLMPSCDFIE